MTELVSRVQKLHGRVDATLPLTDSSYSLMSRIRSSSSVEEAVAFGSLKVRIRCRAEDVQKIRGWLKGAGATDMIVKFEEPEE